MERDNPWSDAASDNDAISAPPARASSPPPTIPLPAGLQEAADPWATFDDRPSTIVPSAPRDIAHQALADLDPFSPGRSTFEESLQHATDKPASPSTPQASSSTAPVEPPLAEHTAADLKRSVDEEGRSSPLLSTLGSLFKRPLATPPPDQSRRTSGLMQAIVGSGSTTPTQANRDLQPPRSPEKASPDAEAPFDFGRFMEQMRDRRADVIARYFRSFLKEFNKRPWKVQEQIRVINDFLDFISTKMRNNEVWQHLSEHDFDNAVEGMEKLVMNRLYEKTFTPALIDESRSNNATDDLERDHVLQQRIRLFQWLREEHLDLPPPSEERNRYITFAQAELRKINQYKAPRDKLITILNCCKVIYGLMRQAGKEEGADTFVPYLILIVLRANPDHLVSNIQYIQRFRNPEKLQGEAGYYLSSLNGALSFIETLDQNALSNITQDEFEHQMEQAVADVEDASHHANTAASSAPVPEPDAAAAQPVQGGLFDVNPLEAIRGVISDLSISNKPSAPAQIITGVPVAQQSLPSPGRRRGYTSSVYSRSAESLVQPPTPTIPLPQVSEEEADARRKQQANLATLGAMFPDAEPSVLEIVLLSQGGNMETAIDSLLEMT